MRNMLRNRERDDKFASLSKESDAEARKRDKKDPEENRAE